MAEYPVGAKVVVRFNPAKPEELVLYRKGEAGRASDTRGIA